MSKKTRGTHQACPDVPQCICSRCIHDIRPNSDTSCCGKKAHRNIGCPIGACPDFEQEDAE